MERLKQRLDIASQALASLQAVGLLDPDEARQALEMTDDRNRTVHTYNEALAEAIFARIPHDVVLMETWMAAIDQRPDDPAEGPNG
ncbi:hypothetical protein AWN76_009195 [Rhodothermaceae bacterium RA]|nr:hypothetical protein AWN76_009195 [Rhodothermaceae bacterium RA]